MMIKIGGYLRCSTKKQSSHNGHVSIAMQKKTVYKYLLLIGLVEKMSDIAWYIEMNLKDLQEKRSKINVSKNIQNLDKRMKTLNDELLGGFIDMDLYKELRDQYTKKKEILEKLLPKKQITTLTAEMSDFERLQFYHMNFDRIIVDCEEKEVVELIYLHKEKKEG